MKWFAQMMRAVKISWKFQCFQVHCHLAKLAPCLDCCRIHLLMGAPFDFCTKKHPIARMLSKYRDDDRLQEQV